MSYKSTADLLKMGWLLLVPISLAGMYGMYSMRDHNKMIVLSPSKTFHISEYSDNETMEMLYERIVRDSLDSFLMRNPMGLDEKKMFDLLFVGTARKVALAQIKQEEAQFRKYSIHQKVERQTVRIVQVDKYYSVAMVKGQLIRSYLTMSGRMNTFTVLFTAKLRIVNSYDFAAIGRYPYRVTEFEYEQAEVIDNGKNHKKLIFKDDKKFKREEI